ncbi:PREDICTED: protein strawberry notch-like [Camelina sativa]|uniref:Protein strawberry notch-like n=1 Tax=Camelina sativa TaxID=90675 RepID=A0ABM0TQP4_CAMSA|nr:PREDICTED: protein strawberry notch-like [Camelina sativa]
MTQSPIQPPPPLPPPPHSAAAVGVLRGDVQVRCAGCRVILRVKTGVVEFSCPTCQLPQMLPPELLSRARPQFPQSQQPPQPPQPQPIQTLPPPIQQQLKPPPLNLPRPPVPAHGIDPTKMQLPCANCQAILNVPHGLTRFSCPQCHVELAVDVSKLNRSLTAPHSHPNLPTPAAPPVPPPPPPEEVNEEAIEVEREEDEGGTAGETFMDYRPPKLSIGPPHPDPIVETSSLSAVQPPEPTYDLKIKEELERSKALSCLQIETLVYACQRHLQHLADGTRAGFFVGDGAGVGKGRTIAGLIWENWKHGRKKALWISIGSDLKYDARRDLDDVGATSVGVNPLNKLPYSKLDSKNVGVKEGVVFLTYNSLIASSEKGRSRLQQLVQWCGPEFDGLLIFDECHKAKNLVPEAGSQPTRIGQAVVDIQDKIPQARVLYCSATGASEPRNMGYMVRLGLWGAGTSFSDFNKFLGALDKGGTGALELVAMDMKARGMYVCRTLSYKGAEFEIVEARLEEGMEAMYNKSAEFWAELRIELLSASAFLPNEKPNSSQLWRLYWSSHQRFFRHLCMSAKVPVTVRLAKKALSTNKCVVIGLQSTGEARTEEAVTKYGLELDDFVSGPRELLLKFVEENYPLPEEPEPLSEDDSVKELQRKRHSASPGVSIRGRVRKMAKWKPDSDDESDLESEAESADDSNDSDDEFQICQICSGEDERKKLLHCSECDKLFHPDCVVPPVTDLPSEAWICYSCKEKTEEYIQARRLYIAELQKRYEAALERKLKIIEIIRALNLPNNPLDDIVDQLGGPDKVAEITGRRGMLVRASNGKGVTYQARNTKDITMEMVNMNEKQLFMDGKKFVAIISEAGSAGVSLQADRRAINQKRRVHLTLELPWSADRAIQQFGRTHRSNQTSAPEYRLLFTNLGGERRFASIVAKRLETLGALTQGDRRAGPSGPSLSAYNYDSNFGKKSLMVMYRGIMEQEKLPVVPPGCSVDEPETIKEFLTKARAALVAVGIVRDSVLANGKDVGKFSGRIIDSDMHDVGRFLNRLLGLPPDIQNRLFELFTSILDVLVHNARIEGSFDSGIVDMKANSVELLSTPKTVHVDQMSGASTMLFTFTLDRGVTWESASSMLEGKRRDGLGSANDGFYESKREWLGKRHFILAFESAASGLFKIVRPAVGESIREMSLSELKTKYRKLSSLEKARTGWEDEYEISSKQCMHGPKCKLGEYCTVGRRIQEVNVVGGLILPIWGTIEKALSKQSRHSHKRVRVIRIETTTDNQRIVGLSIPNAAVETVLQDLAWVQEIDD